jgi:N-acetylglutamate synthase-like GNAT family acetyltransferase
MRVSCRVAEQRDLEDALSLLDRVGQTREGALAELSRWRVLEANGAIVGCGGIEYQLGSDAALLRSLAVPASLRGKGHGRMLVKELVDLARGLGATRIYAFSTGAIPFFTKLGWKRVQVDELVAALPNAAQVETFRKRGWLPTEVAWRAP